MRKTSSLLFFAVTALAIFFKPALAAEDGGSKSQKPTGLAKVAQDTVVTNRTLINVNNMAMWIYSNGSSAIDPLTNSGVYFPRGTNPAATPIFQDGFVWGGRVNDGRSKIISVGGQTYSIGTVPGAIISRGVAENINDRRNVDRIWRIRRDFTKADLRQDAAEFFQITAPRVSEAQIQQIRDIYRQDWIDWPARKGAPFYDANHDGVYTPEFNDDGSPKLFPEADEPGYADADQVVWLVCNDLNSSAVQTMYGSDPIGFEMQLTLWAYRRTDALGNVIFKQFRVIYRGTSTTPLNATIDSLYFCQWSDPDVGAAGDDYAGCDTTLGLGYAYNSQTIDGTYAAVGLPPPASGYDFFAGPLVPSANDTAIFGLKKRSGFRNLPMSTFAFFASGQVDSDPTRGGDYNGTLQWFNLLRGFRPRPESPPDPWRDPDNNITKFRVSGDPVSGSGWIDANAGDRRILQAAGPFKMAVSDTQETVVAAIAALGADRLSSISVLKFYDRFAQNAFDNLFVLPKAPTPPSLAASELDGQIVLNWGSDLEGVAATEDVEQKGFLFEGYNIYQLPSAGAPIEQGFKLGTVDVPNEVTVISQETFDPASGLILELPVQFGTNSGISRSFSIRLDQLRDQELINGQPYYFGVTAYSFDPAPDAVLKTLESPPTVVTVVPQQPKPGTRVPSSYGDTLSVTHTGGSDGVVYPLVIEPAKSTGHEYEVSFADDGQGGFVWNLTDKATSKVLLSDQANQSGDDTYFIVDGVQVKVLGPPPGMKEHEINVDELPWTNANANWGAEGFGGAVGMAFTNWFSGSTITPPDLRKVLLKFAGTDVSGRLLDPNDPDASFGYRYLRGATLNPAQPEFAPYIVNPSAGYAYQDYKKVVPFAAYNVETNPPTRLMVGFLENNVANGRVDGLYWPPHNSDNVGGNGAREFFFVYSLPYSETPDPSLQVDILNTTVPMMWMGTPNRNGDIAFDGNIEFIIVPNYVNAPTDKFIFRSNAPVVDQNVAKQDLATLVNVFPNPYYGVNEFEQNQFNRFVTFSHLPDKAIVRIFNLGGVLVRTLTKGVSDTDNAQFLRWNLQNEAGLPVASGIYVARLEFPDLGVTKNLKIAIIQEQQFLRNF